jgi:hypothetical protein
MENIERNIGSERNALHRDEGSLDSKRLLREALLDDPAAFFIFQLVHVHFQTVSELKSYLSSKPEFLELVDSILSQMEEAAIVRLVGDRIEIVRSTVTFESMEELLSFVPNTFRIASKRVLENEKNLPERRKARSEMVRYMVVPDAPEIAEELREMNSEYKAKMLAIQSKLALREYSGNGLRFVGIVDSVLDAEDFL